MPDLMGALMSPTKVRFLWSRIEMLLHSIHYVFIRFFPVDLRRKKKMLTIELITKQIEYPQFFFIQGNLSIS